MAIKFLDIERAAQGRLGSPAGELYTPAAIARAINEAIQDIIGKIPVARLDSSGDARTVTAINEEQPSGTAELSINDEYKEPVVAFVCARFFTPNRGEETARAKETLHMGDYMRALGLGG